MACQYYIYTHVFTKKVILRDRPQPIGPNGLVLIIVIYTCIHLKRLYCALNCTLQCEHGLTVKYIEGLFNHTCIHLKSYPCTIVSRSVSTKRTFRRVQLFGCTSIGIMFIIIMIIIIVPCSAIMACQRRTTKGCTPIHVFTRMAVSLYTWYTIIVYYVHFNN
jgi:hypothetical protein